LSACSSALERVRHKCLPPRQLHHGLPRLMEFVIATPTPLLLEAIRIRAPTRPHLPMACLRHSMGPVTNGTPLKFFPVQHPPGPLAREVHRPSLLVILTIRATWVVSFPSLTHQPLSAVNCRSDMTAATSTAAGLSRPYESSTTSMIMS